MIAAALAATVYAAGWFRHDSALQGSGTVEARDTRVGSKIGGRIDKVLVREGDRVKPSQVLVTFDDKELRASLQQSRAAAEKSQRGFRPEEIAEARAAAAQAKAEYEQRKNGYRQQDIAAAQADVDRAKADENRARLDFDRYEALAKKDLVSKQQRDTAEAAWRIAVATNEIIADRARVGIKIPVDYSDRLLHQTGSQVLVLIDGSDSSVAGQAINVTTTIGLDESLRRVLSDRTQMAVEMRPKLLFNPDSRSPNFFLPGLTAVLLLNVTTFLTAFSIVREKERGTLEQLFVTPVRPLGLLLGKLLPYLVIGFTELCAIVTFMRFVFQVPIHGNVFLLGLFSLPYLFVSLSIGILVSSKANSQSEAIQLAFLTFLPSISFPATSSLAKPCPNLATSSATLFRPATTSNITRGIILRGAGLSHLRVDALALAAMGTLLLIIAARRFQKKVIMA